MAWAGGHPEAAQPLRHAGSGVGSPGCDFRPRGLWAKEKPVAGRVEARNCGPQICVGVRTIASCLVGSWSPPLRSPNSPADDPLEAKRLLFWLWKEQRGAMGKTVCLQQAGWRAEKPEGQSGRSHTRGEREGVEALGTGRRDGAWLGFVQERWVVPGGDSWLPAAEPEGLGADSSRKFRYQLLALPSKWGFFPSVITDVSCPRNCVLYFRGGASRGDWKPRSNPSSLAQHPSHTQGLGQSEGSGKSGVLTGSQKKRWEFRLLSEPSTAQYLLTVHSPGSGPCARRTGPCERGPQDPRGRAHPLRHSLGGIFGAPSTSRHSSRLERCGSERDRRRSGHSKGGSQAQIPAYVPHQPELPSHTPLRGRRAGPSSKWSRNSFKASKHTSASSFLELRSQGVSPSSFHLTVCQARLWQGSLSDLGQITSLLCSSVPSTIK